MNTKSIVLTSSERILSRLKKNGINATKISADASASEIFELLPKGFSLVYIGFPLTNLSELDMRLKAEGVSWAAFTGDRKTEHSDLQVLGIDPNSAGIIKGICEEFSL